MPEFMPWHSDTQTIGQLDDFTRDYLEAIEWTDCNADHDGDDGPKFDDATGFSVELIERAKADCALFQEENASDLVSYQEQTGYSGGVDFWLTRNHHGAGFWDRGLGDLGQRLTDAARFGEVSAYVGDDLRIYLA